ncbi:protein of unknown function [Thermanaeromonas toyohensis ToBE]|uniref:DUF4912 domain-containing protein n=1 Tax=Thermanaeromonas toyohensis ToBE TaxID=698762 RepID=A0A1W1W0A7_9FIRM|nr:DUF4912 domain-containing protein [Thermanaeromonas toyohensis]SMB98943.1 protein of unknown function [Thermanaeromonas toyohensis ToBE]
MEDFCALSNDLVCLPQDPQTIFVYWIFTPQRIKALQEFLAKLKPEAKLSLRLRCPSSPSLEQEIILSSWEKGSHYFRLIDPHLVYCLELGVRTLEGDFVVFTRSSEIKLGPLEGEKSALFPAGEKESSQEPPYPLPSSFSLRS